MASSDDDRVLSPVEVFDRLGHETRLAILQELATYRRVNWRMEGQTFAELRRAVGTRDPGNFSYHLEKLCDHFVRQVGDEYQLTDAGLEIADAIVAGMYGSRGEPRTATTDYPCPFCEKSVSATHEHELLTLACDDHGTLFGTTLPVGAVEGRSMDDVIRIATRDAQQDIEQACAGVCFHCWGRMHSSLVVGEPLRHPATDETLDEAFVSGDVFTVVIDENNAIAVFGCERCETVFWIPPGGCITQHPAVVSFYYNHGFDIREMPYLDSR